MKYRFLLFSSLLASATVFAQAPAKQVKIAPESNKQLEPAGTPVLMNEGTGQGLTEEEGPILFTEDFGTGAGQWTNVSQNSSSAIWEYRGTSTTPTNATGSQGAYAGTSTPIASPTTSNGFMIFDSDYYDNGGTAGNFGGGPMPAPHDAALTSPEIDCSTESGVLLTFYSYFRHYDANGFVIVTNDNFTSSDTVWNGSDFHDVNTASASDEFVKVNISDVAAGSSTVKIRFVFNGQGNATPTGYYFWMIDDINVVGAADFDLAVTESYFRGAGESDYSAMYSNFYNQLPVSQASSATLKLGALITNSSDAAMTNSVLSADVSGAGTFSGTSAPTTYSTFGEEDFATVTTTYAPSATGNYVVEFSVAADSTDDYPEDNTLEKEFNVTDRTFAWDDGEVGGGISWSSGSHSMFSVFEFFAADTVSAIEFGIWSSATFASDDGAVVEVGMWNIDYDIDGTTGDTNNFALGTPLFTPKFRVMTSDEYTDGTTNDLVRVGLDEPLAVPAGRYLVGYKRSSGTIRTATSDYGWTPLGSWVDADADGVIDGWTANLPIIHVETWSQDICANANIIIDADIICNNAEWTADIDASVFNGTEPYSYEWNTGSDDEDITVDAEGTFTLTVKDANFCEESATFPVANGDINCNLSTGSLNGASFSFTVLPNPNNGVFSVAFEAAKSETVNVEIQSLKGDLVYTSSMNIANGTTTSIDLNGLASGVYVMQVSNETGTTFEKIIIE
ncbi:MAG: T9SS type A sorting domain-containing protein [Cryomorphaceae bacterium]